MMLFLQPELPVLASNPEKPETGAINNSSRRPALVSVSLEKRNGGRK